MTLDTGANTLGGTRGIQERASGRRRRIAPPGMAHNASSYANYGCRCPTCTEDHRVRTARQRSRRWAARQLIHGRWHCTDPNIPHGACSTYANHGCRCSPCSEAQAAANARRSRKADQ